MFEVGFSELLLVALIGLLVLGPERLPVAIRTIYLWIGRLKRSFQVVKAEIEREIGTDEIRRQLQNEEIMNSLDSTRKQVEKISQQADIQKDMDQAKKSVQQIMDSAKAQPAPSSTEQK